MFACEIQFHIHEWISTTIAENSGEFITPSDIYRGSTMLDARILDTSESAVIKETRRQISVTVPDLEELNVARPGNGLLFILYVLC